MCIRASFLALAGLRVKVAYTIYCILYSEKIWQRIKVDELTVDDARIKLNLININMLFNIFTSAKFVRPSFLTLVYITMKSAVYKALPCGELQE